MPYRVTGRDRVTGKPIPAYVSSAGSEMAARAEAGSRGIDVESLEALPDEERARPASPPPLPASAPATAGYEFTPLQNQVIDKLARYMNIAGWAGLLLGGLQVLSGFLSRGGAQAGLANFLQGLVLIIVGILTRRAAQRFRSITESEGRDILELMHALTGLRTLYTFQVWVLGAVIALIVVVILAALART